jgi:hypothetical protein
MSRQVGLFLFTKFKMNAKQVPQCKQKQSYLPSLLCICQKPVMDRNYCLIVFIVYMS